MRKNCTLLFLLFGMGIKLLAQPLFMRCPAISPDGKSIVFSYRGDIFKMPSNGGQAVPLTVHQAHDFMPVWSKDGKSIAFASDRYGNFDIFIMSADGGNANRLTFNSAGDFPSTFTNDNQKILFTSVRLDLASSAQFPVGILPEVYSVPVSGGKTSMVTTHALELATFNPAGTKLIYQDVKGYEDYYRKHHKSAVTRDIWVHTLATNSFEKITNFEGEDRNPIFLNENEFVYLSEESGSFNVFKSSLDGKNKKQLTSFTKHPVRYLSVANDGTLCFSFNGEIYTLKEGQNPQKLMITIPVDAKTNQYKNVPVSGGATEFALASNGKELAFVFRGEIFVTSVEGGITKRITNTPEQERSVSFSPDGRSLLYAGERNGSWNIYKTSIVRKEEPYFYASTILKEEPVVETAADEFQPAYSPDGKEVAYLEERVILKVFRPETKITRTILTADVNYSYSDGDQWYHWSPDGKWFVHQFLQPNYWSDEVGLTPSSGTGKTVNLTQNGYEESTPRWMNDGKMVLFFSWRDGMKNHGSWGAETDAYAIFMNQDALDKFKMSKEDYKLWKEKDDKEKKEKEEKEKEQAKDKKKEDKKKDDKTDKAEKLPEVRIELDGISDRRQRLTLHSAFLADAILSKDGEKLYYVARFEKGFNVWVSNLREKETKILAKLDAPNAGNLVLDKEGKNLFLLNDGRITKIEVESGKVDGVGINATMELNTQAERAYIFNHAWRQVTKKFYRTDLHGVDWEFYKKEYERFLPHLSSNYEFEECLSELLGELNASHTGSGFIFNDPNGDRTASLGAFFDPTFTGNGLKITEIIKKGPLDKAGLKVKAGHIIEKIDGIEINNSSDWSQLLNLKADKNTLLSLNDESTKTKYEEVVKPIGRGQEYELLYKRWVENRRAEVEKLSGGKIGYVHVEGMDDPSYRVFYEEVLGKNANKEALIVDTRFNGGGWLHDDLATFLSGKTYVTIEPRGQKLGSEPARKWNKPSAVLMGESNYSDAHFFPYTYKALGIGKLIGMPVPGTATAVWWESQIDPSLYFGIPQVGIKDMKGNYLENTQLEPDVKVAQKPEVLMTGRDEQIEKAVQELMKEIGK